MFKHYGVDVLFQRCECSFANFLKQQGEEYKNLYTRMINKYGKCKVDTDLKEKGEQ